MRVLGIMSGTSIDSVDYAVCRFSNSGRITLEDYWQAFFPKQLQFRLKAAAEGSSSAHETGQLHHDLGRFYAAGARKIKSLDLAGLHGQTIFHRPRGPRSATFQIGEPVYLAVKLGVPIVSNFRAADLAMGGQGAPLATMFHLHVFAQKGKHVAVNNLGGISNVTSLDWKSTSKPLTRAFDTGPANMLLDLAMGQFTQGRARYDRDGLFAGGGTANLKLAVKWLRHPFIKSNPPKSTGRELFGQTFLNEKVREMTRLQLSRKDMLATLVEFTARSISENYRLHLPSFPEEVLLCGGGARNPFLFARIASALREWKSDIQVNSTNALGWDPQRIEASAFALLAWLAWKKKPGNIASTTGAAKDCLLGQVTFPP